jgi:cell division protein FtsI (penicillin-binding protein 3)
MGVGGAAINRRLIAIAVLMGVWGIAIGARLYSIQVVQSDDFRSRAERQQQRVLDISPHRGAIYDRHGNELAVSIEVDSLYAVPSEIDDPAATAATLSEILNVPTPSLEARLDSDRSFTWLERKVTAREASQIRAADIDGLYFQKEPKRFYPNRELASHVLGFVNIDDHGGSGVEYRYDELIGGTPGKLVVMTDARGRSFHRLEQAPTGGASLTTTIDQTIQYIVEKEIAKVVQDTGAVGVSVIVMNPDNGEVLAMANYPDFNPNEYGQSPPRSWSNRAISHVYEPGSTFKIATAAAAFEEDLTELEELIDCEMGSIVLYGHRIRDHKAFGVLSVREIMQYSSDVGIIKLGLRLGDERFAGYIDRFGFGQKTGIDLPGEERGLSKPASDWSAVSVGAISMGQEIGTTPLQIVNLVSMVANGGMLYRPVVVKRVDDPRTGTSEETPTLGHRVMSLKTAAYLQDALRTVVTDGTARLAQIPGYTVAGKTGTAQKLDRNTGTYSHTKHVASFTGYAPARNPKISAIVVIDEPQGPDGGGEVAAPVFRRIVEQILRYESVPTDIPEDGPGYTEENEVPTLTPPTTIPPDDFILDQWEVVDASLQGNPGLPTASADPDGSVRYAPVGIPVPAFYGKSLRQVADDSLRLGLRLQSSGSGVAVAQTPTPGTPVPAGTRVQVQFSTTRSAVPSP